MAKCALASAWAFTSVGSVPGVCSMHHPYVDPERDEPKEGSMSITLRPITAGNWEQCVELSVEPEQKDFVSSNAYSLAQAAYEDDCVPLAMYHDETMVGFTMYWHLPGEAIYHINRLMVDEAHQQKGYGRAAMEQLITRLRAYQDCRGIDISYAPENHVAQRLYASLGFRETGEIDDGEVVALLTLVHEQS